MGLVAMGGMVPTLEEGGRSERRDRRLRANTPNSLLSGPAAKRPIALAQAYLAAGACVTGTLGRPAAAPGVLQRRGPPSDPGRSGYAGLLFMFLWRAVPVGLMRLGPAVRDVAHDRGGDLQRQPNQRLRADVPVGRPLRLLLPALPRWTRR